MVLFRLIKRFYDWKYYNRTITLISVICTALGLFGIGSSCFNHSAEGHHIASGDHSIAGDGNVVDCRNVSADIRGNSNVTGNGNAVGHGNVVGNGNTIYNYLKIDEATLVSIIQMSMASNLAAVAAIVDAKIANERNQRVLNEEPLFVRNPAGLDFLAGKAREAMRQRDYSNAVEFAVTANKMVEENLVEARKREQFDVEGAFLGNMERIYPILMENALAHGKFKEMAGIAEEFRALFTEFNPYAEAMLDIAHVRQEGRRLVFFSPERVRELHKIEKTKLKTYLSILAMYGYLQPVGLNYANKSIYPVEYGRMFGIGHALPYQEAFRIEIASTNQTEKFSNEISCQWCGLGKLEMISINDDASDAMGLPDCERVKLPIKLWGAVTSDARTRRGLGRPVETSLKWTNSLAHADVKRAYEVIIRDYDGERVEGETSDESFEVAEGNRVKVPEPSCGLLIVIGLSCLSLKRKRVA